MSVSQNGRLYFSDEELEKALLNNNALEYAMARGYHLVKTGSVYTLKEHDSMVFLPPEKAQKSSWYWNSQGLYGNAIDFMVHYEGMSKVEAILTLAQTIHLSAPVREELQKAASKPRRFVLPEHAQNYRQLFGYLNRQRGIDHSLIKSLVDAGKLYQGVTYAHFDIAGYDGSGQAFYKIKERFADKFHGLPWQNRIVYAHGQQGACETSCISSKAVRDLAASGDTKAYQNVIMVGFAPDNAPYYASMRSIGGSYKVDVTGSRKDYGFALNEDSPCASVCVFESPIEAMSYWSLCRELGSPRIDYPMISLGGAGTPLALRQFLHNHPQIHDIVTGLNMDTQDNGHKVHAGQLATQRIQQEFGTQYTVTVHQPGMNDWNDVLVNYRKNLQQLSAQMRPVPSVHKQNRSQPAL